MVPGPPGRPGRLGAGYMPEALKIGAKKQLFIDDFLIDETLGVCRNLNQPAKYVGNP